MKKQSRKLKLCQIRKSRMAVRRLKKINKKFQIKNTYRKSSKPKKGQLIAPPHFVIVGRSGRSISGEIDDYFNFLNKLRGTNSSHLQIDMSGVKRMVSPAALLFKAELSKLIELKNVKISAIPPNSDRTRQVLKQTDLARLLNLNIEESPHREDVVHWRVAEGPSNILDPSALAPIMDDIESVTGMSSHPVYQGVVESMANCVEHAYKNHPDVNWEMPKNPGWWVFQQVKDETLHVVVCDLGIGIRRSLPLTLAAENGLYKKLMHLARGTKGSDNRSLLAAMEYGRTSTGMKQRGKGMQNAHKVVNDLGEGTFFAMSNSGCYQYTKKQINDKGTHTTVKLRHSIQGTILGWRLPLSSSKSKVLT
jgi:anti-anti-sigma regulatory factor